ncbi:MAG TPA: hypothetical protein PKA22_07240, partial [Rhodocyclaceae bacterium]|nr:hypothetical protein [Rhodocyclaceae bacterium]
MAHLDRGIKNNSMLSPSLTVCLLPISQVTAPGREEPDGLLIPKWPFGKANGGYWAQGRIRAIGQYPTVQHSNKLTLKGL